MGGKLLQTCEDAASRRGCECLSLEVRADNERAIAFYKRHGYEIEETIEGFYKDGTNALRMVKSLEYRGTPEVNFEIPYYAQTSEFTCGPACLMMAMKYLDPAFTVRRSTEFMLWKEATLIFMMGGLGGCGPFGLAVAALKRGYTARVIISDKKTPFLSSVRDHEKKNVIRLVHDQLKYEAREFGVVEEYYKFAFDDIAEAMRDGMVPIVLISSYRMHKARVPHWVIVTGYDSKNVYFHDPYDGFYLHDNGRAQHLRIPIPEFRKMRGYGKNSQKIVVFIGLPEEENNVESQNAFEAV